METYRMINKELSINNQELRNVINKLKHEVTYLNRRLLDQREEFNILKATMAKTIELNYRETMALIYPNNISNEKRRSKLDIVSHRRSCSNVTAADPINNRSNSPPAGSSSCASDVMDELTFKRPIPRIVIERSIRLSKSPSKNLKSDSNQSQTRKSGVSDLQTLKSSTQDLNSSDTSEIEETLTSNTSLVTINEEKSCGLNLPNENIDDVTINCSFNAPCSTPYNLYKEPYEKQFKQKKLRVLVKRISEDKLSELRSKENRCPVLSVPRIKNTSFRSKSAQIEACHSERENYQFNPSYITARGISTCKADLSSSSDGECFAPTKTTPNKIKSKEKTMSLKEKSIKLNSSSFTTTNNSTWKYSINSSSDGESFPVFKTMSKKHKTTRKCSISSSSDLESVSAFETTSNKMQTRQNKVHTDDKSIKITEKEGRSNGKTNKENYQTESDSDAVFSRRLRNKKLSLKEPSLRKKLRNTTNMKL